MGTVAVNPPKTPVTKGSNGIAAATVPNVCKMPGPPAPFVPTPLPNIGKSSDSPKSYSKKVKFDGKTIAIKGASFKSKGDAASKGLGGGMVSLNTHGEAKFIGPGSMDVKVEGKNVQLLSDPMMNNCGPSGSPANSATLTGIKQLHAAIADALTTVAKACNQAVNDQWDKDHPNGPKHTDCLNTNTGETMRVKGEDKPKPVQVKLGELKEQCVNDTLGEDPGTLRSQEAFGPDGKSIGKGKPYGSAIPREGGGIPDFCMANSPLKTSKDVTAIFELKFPCKKGKKKGNLSNKQKKNWPKLFNCPIHIIP